MFSVPTPSGHILALTRVDNVAEVEETITEPNVSAARLAGMNSAIADLRKMILMLKEYPPLPYAPHHPEYIRLLESEFQVSWKVINSKDDSQDLCEEVGEYNDVMRAEIEHLFGRDILERIEDRAKGK